MINWKFLTITITMACVSLGLVSCPNRSKPVPSPSVARPSFHVYIVFAPINPNATTLARQFIANAKENIQDQTQIIVPGNTYTVGEICQGDLPDFPLSDLKVTDSSSIQAVTDQMENSLETISQGKKTCDAKEESLVNLATNLNQAANSPNKQEKMILIIQTPWVGRAINDKTFNQIKAGMDKLSKTGKVEKVILIGVNEKGRDRLAQAFESFGQMNKLSSTVGQAETIEKMKTIRKDDLKAN